MIRFISNIEHYSIVLSHCKDVKHTLWMGTADIKDLYISNGKTDKPFLGVFSELIGKGVKGRLIHAKEPVASTSWLEDLKRYSMICNSYKIC